MRDRLLRACMRSTGREGTAAVQDRPGLNDKAQRPRRNGLAGRTQRSVMTSRRSPQLWAVGFILEVKLVVVTGQMHPKHASILQHAVDAGILTSGRMKVAHAAGRPLLMHLVIGLGGLLS